MSPVEPRLLAQLQASPAGPRPPPLEPTQAAPSQAAQWLAALEEPSWLVSAADGCLLQANAAAAEWLGWAHAELAGRLAEELLPSLEDAAFWAERRAERQAQAHPAGLAPSAAQPGARLLSNVELPRHDGRVAQVARRIMPLGQPAWAYLVSLHDRSAEHRAEQERERLLAELRATLEATADGILVTDTAGHIRAFNRRFADLWQLPPAALAAPNELAVFDWMRRSVLEPEAYQRQLDDIGRQLLLQCTDTVALLDGRQLERHTQPQWSAGQPIGRVYSFRPHRKLRAQLADAGSPGLDALTGWPNRAAFVAQLDTAVQRAQTEGQPLALLCVAFDRHALYALDGGSRARALEELAEGLRACVREPHLLAHLGAARYALLLSHAGEAGAEQVARRLVALAQAPSGLAQGLLATAGLRVQVGVAVYPQAGRCADELLAHAERAQQHCGQAGSAWQAHQLSAEPRPQDRRRQRLHKLVQSGLGGDALRLHFQPRVDSQSHAVQAVEALLRWHDSDSGLLLPGQFLRSAEEEGLIGALDDWALEHALRQASVWRHQPWASAEAPGVPTPAFAPNLTVNLSAQTLCQPALARRVAALLQATGWPAQRLELDVSESALARDREGTGLNLQALHRLGVRLTLDGWGVGPTSLALLRELPFQAVKFDRRLLRHLPHQPQERALLQGLAQLARGLGLYVWATGVENQAQRACLLEAGCQGWQGHLAAAAMEAQALERSVLARPQALAQRLAPKASPPGSGSLALQA